MKNLFKYIFYLIILIIPVGVFAEGNITASPSNLTIERGKSKTFTISAYNTIGDVSISSSNSNIATVSSSEWSTGMVEEKQTKTVSIKVKAISNGDCEIILKIDGATFDSEDLSGQVRKIKVSVVEPVVYSANNNLKELSVEGYQIEKIDDNNYILSVNNDVSSININAIAEDEKATVSGIGTKELQNGENVFQITIKAENGAQNVINLKVNKKDGYYLEDLNHILDGDIKEIIINHEDMITKDQINEIKKSKKSIELNYYNFDKKNVYGWKLDGSKIETTSEFNTKLVFETEYIEDIKKEANYAEGLAVSFSHNGKYPEAAVVKLYVGNNFEAKDKVNLYYYDSDSKDLVYLDNLEVNGEGYVEYPVTEQPIIYLTKAQIEDVSKDMSVNYSKGKSNVVIIILIEAIQIGIIAALVVLVLKNKKKVVSDGGFSSSETLISNNSIGTNSFVQSSNGTSAESISSTPAVQQMQTPIVSSTATVQLPTNNQSQNVVVSDEIERL